MSELKKYIQENNKTRIALVGANSQGKSYALSHLDVDKDSIIYVDAETKPDENMRNSADKTTLIDWITNLIGLEKINNVLNDIIRDLNLNNNINGVNIEIEKSISTYKGLLKFNTTTNNNNFSTPGSGEKALGQLLMIENILKNKKSEKFKWLLFDEPENYLHPSLYPLISKTLKSISESGITVIIATHSSEILKYFIEDLSEVIRMKDGKIYPLKEDKYYANLISTMDIYVKPEFMMDTFKHIKDMSDRYFSSIIKEEILKSVFSDLIILGEGVAEEEIFKLFVKKYPELYYENNINTIVTFGKDLIPWYCEIFNDIGIKTLALYDLDYDKNYQNKHIAINNMIEEKSSLTIKVYDYNNIQKNDIEDFLNAGNKDKTKHLIALIREMWLKNDSTLLSFLALINDSIKLLIEQEKIK